MNEPYFWRVRDRKARASAPMTRLLLSPVAAAYAMAGQRRLDRATPEDPGVPVICVGNLTLGGAGKTPVAADIRRRLAARGVRGATLSRGYKGELEGPTRVDPTLHTAKQVGDEPLMLASSGEAWVSKDRPAGARAMKKDGVQVVIMDDGHQNPSLKKALSIIVIDTTDPFGNGFVFPKGPLREPVRRGLTRADAVVLMGEGDAPHELDTFDRPVFRARLTAVSPPPPGRYIAFAGIGRPERFFDSLERYEGVTLSEAVPYPDHHNFTPSDIHYLMQLSRERDARLLTTDKDYVRLPVETRRITQRASVEARFEDGAGLDALLSRAADAAS
ncbi:MAG: tetraacyldisaccharide 4'-kinase [Alphaproteobacteria bacterium]|nr:tetraacyldisaccharide 4'-kinase [Alphaproteobacteria bacterium]